MRLGTVSRPHRAAAGARDRALGPVGERAERGRGRGPLSPYVQVERTGSLLGMPGERPASTPRRPRSASARASAVPAVAVSRNPAPRDSSRTQRIGGSPVPCTVELIDVLGAKSHEQPPMDQAVRGESADPSRPPVERELGMTVGEEPQPDSMSPFSERMPLFLDHPRAGRFPPLWAAPAACADRE